MTGPRAATERVRKRILFHGNREICCIHVVDSRPKQNIDPSVPAKLIVRRFRARIFFVITSGSELERIDENTERYFAVIAGSVARDPDQFTMATMERAHCRDEDAAPVVRSI